MSTVGYQLVTKNAFRLLFLFLFSLFNIVFSCYSQQVELGDNHLKYKRYAQALDTLQSLLESNGKFSTSVFCVENTYHNCNLLYTDFKHAIDELLQFVNRNAVNQKLKEYNFADSINYIKNFSIFASLFDTLNIKRDWAENKRPRLILYSYSHSDPTGKENWSNMFVTNLLVTRKGNCHSLTYLYKILADELGAKCWLTLAPNHIYIRNYSRKTGWYNTELTSGTFPTDAWIATTTYVSTDAIRSGIYMDTLSNQQSIALCILDLAKGYEFQTHNYYDGFILKCCDIVLKYHPVNPMALLLKAETLKKVYFRKCYEKNPDSSSTYSEMENTYIALANLHYREMPEKMYEAWLKSLTLQNKKYPSKQVIKQPPLKR